MGHRFHSGGQIFVCFSPYLASTHFYLISTGDILVTNFDLLIPSSERIMDAGNLDSSRNPSTMLATEEKMLQGRKDESSTFTTSIIIGLHSVNPVDEKSKSVDLRWPLMNRWSTNLSLAIVTHAETLQLASIFDDPPIESLL